MGLRNHCRDSDSIARDPSTFAELDDILKHVISDQSVSIRNTKHSPAA